jgi:Short C-terminal domain/Phospholipase_D-nuclease N-terminal
MLAYTYPLLDIFWTMLWFFCFFIYIWLLVIIFSDIFRSHDMGGWAKAGWVLFVIVLPFLGILVYLIARGGKMHERQMRDATQAQQEFDSYVRDVAGSGGAADQLSKLADLRQRGVITDAEFEAQKAKILA